MIPRPFPTSAAPGRPVLPLSRPLRRAPPLWREYHRPASLSTPMTTPVTVHHDLPGQRTVAGAVRRHARYRRRARRGGLARRFARRRADTVRHRRLGPGGRRGDGQDRLDGDAGAGHDLAGVRRFGTAGLAPLILAHAPIWVIFATALVVNMRFVIFSALLAPHFAHLPWRSRFLLGYVTGDMTVAMFMQRYPSEAPARGKLSYLKGLLYPNWAAWQIGSIAGIFLGSAVPAEWGLGFAGTLAILCITVPLVANWAALAGVL